MSGPLSPPLCAFTPSLARSTAARWAVPASGRLSVCAAAPAPDDHGDPAGASGPTARSVHRVLPPLPNDAEHLAEHRPSGAASAQPSAAAPPKRAHAMAEAAANRLAGDLKDQQDEYWRAVLPKVQYLGPVGCAKVQAALEMACDAHRGQLRKSGEPFVTHPVAVACILAELGMDVDCVIAGLLHDTVEDTSVTFEQVEARFGTSVRKIVEGETKVSKLPTVARPGGLALSPRARHDEQAENLRWMFVAMTEDWRIIVVKLADRLHNLRTLQFMAIPKQKRIASETLEIFAPLAHRLGLWGIKSELENLSFYYLNRHEYDRVDALVKHRLPKYARILDESRHALQDLLLKDRTINRCVETLEITARSKELYSVWAKMKSNECSITQIYDLVALRVIIDPKTESSAAGLFTPSNGSNYKAEQRNQISPTAASDQMTGSLARALLDDNEADRDTAKTPKDLEESLCYYILGLVHGKFKPFPQRVKDYLCSPKPNGYRSLHTTVYAGDGPEGQALIEVQIRSKAMHKVAEYGRAAHCAFNDKNVTDTSWLNSIRECENDISSSREFVEAVRQDVLGRRVFIFVADSTDSGTTQVMNLPRGATVVDAAYEVNSKVPVSLLCGKINGTVVQLGSELANGDVLSFVTSDYAPGPEPQWLEHARVRATRTKLKLYFRDKRRKANIAKGWGIVQDYLRVRRAIYLYDATQLDLDQLSSLGYESSDELCLRVAKLPEQEQDEILDQLGILFGTAEEQSWKATPDTGHSSKARMLVSSTGQSLVAQTASCCCPLPGDDVFGHTLASENLPMKIHRDQCVYGTRLRNTQAGHCVDLTWADLDTCQDRNYRCWLKVVCDDRNGLLSEVTAVLSSLGVFIKATQSVTVDDIASLEYCLHLQSQAELIPVVRMLSKVSGVQRVERKGSSGAEYFCE